MGWHVHKYRSKVQCLKCHCKNICVIQCNAPFTLGIHIAPPQEKWHNSKIFNFQIMWSLCRKYYFLQNDHIIWKLKILELCHFSCGGVICCCHQCNKYWKTVGMEAQKCVLCIVVLCMSLRAIWNTLRSSCKVPSIFVQPQPSMDLIDRF
jgi:hypothetical protein